MPRAVGGFGVRQRGKFGWLMTRVARSIPAP